GNRCFTPDRGCAVRGTRTPPTMRRSGGESFSLREEPLEKGLPLGQAIALGSGNAGSTEAPASHSARSVTVVETEPLLAFRLRSRKGAPGCAAGRARGRRPTRRCGSGAISFLGTIRRRRAGAARLGRTPVRAPGESAGGGRRHRTPPGPSLAAEHAGDLFEQ